MASPYWGFETISFYRVGFLTICWTLDLEDKDFILEFTILVTQFVWLLFVACPAWVTLLTLLVVTLPPAYTSASSKCTVFLALPYMSFHKAVSHGERSYRIWQINSRSFRLKIMWRVLCIIEPILPHTHNNLYKLTGTHSTIKHTHRHKHWGMHAHVVVRVCTYTCHCFISDTSVPYPWPVPPFPLNFIISSISSPPFMYTVFHISS